MADNTDTDLLDWLSQQTVVEAHRPPSHHNTTARWYLRVDGIAIWEADLRRAIALIKELKGETKTASKGE